MATPLRAQFRTRLPVSAQALDSYHHLPGAFERLAPPFAPAKVVSYPPKLVAGSTVEIRAPFGPFSLPWVARITESGPGGFVDVQERGPFAEWRHEHRFLPQGPLACELVDDIAYRLPGGPLGQAVAGAAIAKKLERVFRYRHGQTGLDLVRFLRQPGRLLQRQHVLISGGTGLLGQVLEPLLRMTGSTVHRLTRRPRRPTDRAWDPARNFLAPDALDGIDAIVHLAGENIAGGRWTSARRRAILESRTVGTRLLAEAIARAPQPPRVVVSASGSSLYGPGGPHGEDSPPGTGFLAEVVHQWEAAWEPTRAVGCRVVCLRFGVLLSSAGGALAKLLTPFQLGLGGPIGHGQQRLSWLALDDAADLIHCALGDPRYSGAINAVAPAPVSSTDFAAALNRVLGQRGGPTLPAWVLETVFGEMARETLLADNAVAPLRLAELGYVFRHPRLTGALAFHLGLPNPDDTAGG